MPQIPGLNQGTGLDSGVPGLGPAPPVGGGLPDFTNAPSTGIPGLSGGASRGIPGLSSSLAPTLPPVSRTPVLSPTRIQSIDDGLAIIQRVKNRELTWQQANALISTMGDKDRNELMRRLQTTPGTGPDELLAVAGKGHPANILGKTLGIGTNLLEDTRSLVFGAIPGAYHTAVATATDIGRFEQDPIGTVLHPGQSKMYQDILKPMYQGYKEEYGPIFSGDFEGFSRQFAKHPLQPILDAFAVASAGGGAGVRIAAGLDLRRALRVTNVEDFAKPAVPENIANLTHEDLLTDPMTREAFDLPNSKLQYAPLRMPRVPAYIRPTAEQIANQPWMRNFSVLYNRATGKTVFSPVGSGHDDIFERMIDLQSKRQGRPLTQDEIRQFYDKVNNDPDIVQGTGIFDEQGGIVVNLDDYGNPIPAGSLHQMETHVEGQANELYKPLDHYKQLVTEHVTPKEMKWPKNAVAVVGGMDTGVRVEQMTNGLYRLRDASGQLIRSNFPEREAAVSHAQSLISGGVDPAALVQSVHETRVAGKYQRSFQRATEPGRFVTEHHEAGTLTTAAADALHDEVEAWGQSGSLRNRPAGEAGLGGELRTSGPGSIAHSAIDQARVPPPGSAEYGYPGGGYQSDLLEVRDPQGRLQAVGSYEVDHANQIIHGGYTGARQGGAGIAWLHELAKKYPGYRMEFSAASERIAQYYRDIGATESHGGFGSTFEISADKMAGIARGEWLNPETVTRQRVVGAGLEPMTSKEIRSAAVGRSLRMGPQGGFIDAYERARGITHLAEITQLGQELNKILDDPELQLDRRTFRQVWAQVRADIRETQARDTRTVRGMGADQPAWYNPEGSQLLAKTLTGAGVTLREASDLIRAGTVFIRFAYLPNNWVSNAFMNLVDQGGFAPYHLARSFALDKHLGTRYTRGIDTVMGFNPAEVLLGGAGRGYVASATDPIAHIMGQIGDQPFRRSQWLHEAYRGGYKTLSQVRRLFDDATGSDSRRAAEARTQIASFGQRGQEAIVKFGHMSEKERSILRNLVFVYSWMRGAARYFGRFPMQHAIQTAAYGHLSGVGNQFLQQTMGGVPSFLLGAIPVGRDDKGNPILVNPVAVNPFGTGLQELLALQATYNVAIHPTQFNKYVQEDVVGLMNPLIQSYVTAREGGKAVLPGATQNIGLVRLEKGLAHPGSGSIYPGTRAEAVGQFVVGGLYPRKADQPAITRSLERENRDNPVALIPQQVKDYEKATGQNVPQDLIDAYTNDVRVLQQEKDFKRSYASSHGSQGFTNLPPENRAEAAIEYLSKHNLVTPDQIQTMKDQLDALTTDAEFNDYSNTLWSMTGSGVFRRAWQDLMKVGKAEIRSRKRQ